MTFSPFGNGRKRVVCMGERNGTVVAKQALEKSPGAFVPRQVLISARRPETFYMASICKYHSIG